MKQFAIFLCIMSLAILAASYGMERFLHWPPCKLCVWQRVPYVSAAALSFLAVFMHHPRFLFLLIVSVFLGGTLLALYHIGVEQYWWENAFYCAANIPVFTDSATFLDTLQEHPISASCHHAQHILGLSLATWNAIVSFILACVTFLYVQRHATSWRSFSQNPS